MLAHDDFSRRVEHAGSAVVSEAAPGGQHAGLAGRCQLPNRRKAPQEFMVVRNHRGYPSLLQHDFGEPDAVGIAG